ncbi:MAG: tetratricopeptide repeat protein, partial [Planctomycetes bacterium]|nr:tetratricopeptide repeat protein [Planctomycetota bacterium]
MKGAAEIKAEEKRTTMHRTKIFRTGMLLFIIAAAVRIVYLFEHFDHPTFETPVVDSFAYHQAATLLAQGQGMSERFFFQPFFYPAFLGAIFWATSSSILAAKIVQIVLGGFTCLLTYLLGRRIFGPGAALAAGLIVALYGPLIFFESQLLATGLAAFWSVLLLFLFLKVAESSKYSLFLLLGLSGGLSVLTRPTFLPFFLVGLGWLGFSVLRSRRVEKKPLPGILLIALGFAVPTLAVAVANRQTTGHFGFLPSSGGMNLYVGNNPDYEKTVNARLGSQWSDVTDLPKRHGVKGDSWARQRFYYQQVKNYFLEEPLSFLSNLGEKSLQFISSREMPRNVDPYLFRDGSVILSALFWKLGAFGFPFGLLFPLAVLGWFFARKTIPRLLWLSALVYACSVIAVFVTARYRLPVIPLLAVLAGNGLVTLLQAIGLKQKTVLLAATGILAVTFLLTTLPGPFAAEKIDYAPELHCALGDALHRRGRIEEAIEQFRQALDLDENYVEAHATLGDLYTLQGRTDDAIEAYERALRIKPDLAQAHRNLAALLTDKGDYEAAIEHCSKGLKVRPHEEAFCFNLARIYAEQGRFDAAKTQLLEALRRNPDHGPSHFELARRLEREGKPDEALSHYEKAGAAGNDPEIRNRLVVLNL